MKKRPAGRLFFKRRRGSGSAGPPKALRGWFIQAALSHIAVSNALLINGMFMPKLALTAFFALLAAGFASLGATSVARSHDPISWERATEKNKNT
jgi:hypothetical protein